MVFPGAQVLVYIINNTCIITLCTTHTHTCTLTHAQSFTDPEETKAPSVPEPAMTDLPPTHQQIRELKDQLINQKEEVR